MKNIVTQVGADDENACPAAARAVSWVAVELLFLLGCGGPLVDLVGRGAGAAGAAGGRADAVGAVGKTSFVVHCRCWAPSLCPR